MERTYIENGRRSTSKESTRWNPCRKEKPRSTVEKMERRTGLNKPPAYMKRRRRFRWCGAEEETSAHILCKCEAVVVLRHSYLGSFFLDPEDVRSLSMGAIRNRSKRTGMT